MAKAVPHEPLPKTAACVMPNPSRAAVWSPCDDSGRRRRHSGDARVVAQRRRRLTADPLEQGGEVTDDTVGGGAQDVGRRLVAAESSRSTGGPAIRCIVLRGKSRTLFAYGARTSCGPHCATGTTGAPVASAIRAAPVLPTIGQSAGVAGDRTVGVDAHALTGAHRLDRRGERACRVGRLAVDRYLARPPHDPPGEGQVEQRRLGEEAWRPAAVPDEVGEAERVEVADVVGDQDDPTRTRHVVPPAPVAPGQQQQRRPQHRHGEPQPRLALRPPHAC
jgi:hypothetical protein